MAIATNDIETQKRVRDFNKEHFKHKIGDTVVLMAALQDSLWALANCDVGHPIINDRFITGCTYTITERWIDECSGCVSPLYSMITTGGAGFSRIIESSVISTSYHRKLVNLYSSYISKTKSHGEISLLAANLLTDVKEEVKNFEQITSDELDSIFEFKVGETVVHSSDFLSSNASLSVTPAKFLPFRRSVITGRLFSENSYGCQLFYRINSSAENISQLCLFSEKEAKKSEIEIHKSLQDTIDRWSLRKGSHE